MRKASGGLVGPRRELVDRVGDRMEAAMRGLATGKRARLSEVARKMDVLSPLATLRRGYALPQDAEGRILRTVGAFAEGDHFALRVSDGTVPCEVQGES